MNSPSLHLPSHFTHAHFIAFRVLLVGLAGLGAGSSTADEHSSCRMTTHLIPCYSTHMRHAKRTSLDLFLVICGMINMQFCKRLSFCRRLGAFTMHVSMVLLVADVSEWCGADGIDARAQIVFKYVCMYGSCKAQMPFDSC
jgi:hypothetical protein